MARMILQHQSMSLAVKMVHLGETKRSEESVLQMPKNRANRARKFKREKNGAVGNHSRNRLFLGSQANLSSRPQASTSHHQPKASQDPSVCSPHELKIHPRTRNVFDVALKVHLNIQKRDLEVGRNLGNWILRLLDRYKPSAQIRKQDGESMTNAKKQISSSSILKMPESSQTLKKPKSSRQLFTSSTNIWPKQFPTISMMIKSSNPASNMIQHRHFGILTPVAPGPKYVRGW
uniref:Uncharacterized protein n=1 Tax=Cucumis melo TaxID=3656 RepID=A0A9I9D606_CUCME